MPTLDIFSNDAFSLQSLTNTVISLPHVPTKIGSSGLFTESGITTTTFSIESVGDVLSLVPAGVRGSSGRVRAAVKRKMINFATVHLPQRDAVNADEVQGLRAFGTESDVVMVTTVVNGKLIRMRRDLDVTIEYQRIGAIKGIVYDADGVTELLNMYTAFGVSQQTLGMALTTDTTKVLLKVVEAKRLAEDHLGGILTGGYRVYCSASFFDALVSHPAVERTWLNYQQGGAMLRSDLRMGFMFGDVEWVEYRGNVGGIPFIEADAAYMVPTGVPDLFMTKYAPADYIETVNTNGLPYYAKHWIEAPGKAVELETQSNPISMCTRPRAIVKLTKV